MENQKENDSPVVGKSVIILLATIAIVLFLFAGIMQAVTPTYQDRIKEVVMQDMKEYVDLRIKQNNDYILGVDNN